MKSPSMASLFVTGLIILALLVMFYQNGSVWNRLPFDRKCIIIGIFGILIGVHGMLHLGAEVFYNYNPLA